LLYEINLAVRWPAIPKGSWITGTEHSQTISAALAHSLMRVQCYKDGSSHFD
jgi:hypothetical protein